MALKQIKLKRSLEIIASQRGDAVKELEELKAKEEELRSAFEEAETKEDLDLVGEEADEHESKVKAVNDKIAELDKEKEEKERELNELLEESETVEDSDNGEEEVKTEKPIERKGVIDMEIRTGFFKGWELERANALVEREDSRQFLDNVRSMAKNDTRAVKGVDLTIPDVYLGIIRDNVYSYSKLLKYVMLRKVNGTSRMNIVGDIPEAIWTEACATLNELDFYFNQVEVDGYKTGGHVAICNAALEDSNLELAGVILEGLSIAIAKSIDKAILYGTGKKMPLGIVTRLAQKEKPDYWSEKNRKWVDLSTTNIKQVNAGKTDKDFFSNLLLDTAVAKPNLGSDGLFWAMNRQTMKLLESKALNFNASGMLVAGIDNSIPVIGGAFVEIPFMADGDIVGGFGSQYLVAERAGVHLGRSEHVQFIEDNTVFKGTGRYDGKPIDGAGFVALNIAGKAPTLEVAFAPDEANEPKAEAESPQQ